MVFKKNSIFRAENFGIALILIFYLAIILPQHLDYITVVLPLMQHYYFSNIFKGVGKILFNYNTCYVYFCLIFSFFIKWPNHLISFKRILLLAALGFWLSYYLQGAAWFYHLYPVLALTLLLSILSFHFYTENFHQYDFHFKYLIFIFLFFVIVYSEFIPYIIAAFKNFPLITNFVFAAFSLYLVRKQQNIFLLTTIFSAIFFTAFIFSYFKFFDHYLFLLTPILLSVFFTWFTISIRHRDFAKVMFAWWLGILIIMLPLLMVEIRYSFNKTYTTHYRTYINELKKLGNASIAFYTYSNEFAYPALFFTHQTLGARFTGFYTMFSYPNDPYLEQQSAKILTDDLDYYKPQYVFLDVSSLEEPDKYVLYCDKIDLLNKLAKYPEFQKRWHHYHYVKTIDIPPLVKFRVFAYQKIETEN